METLALNDTEQLALVDVWDISIQNNRAHILLKCTWDILKDRPYVGTEDKSNKFNTTKIITSIQCDPNGIKLEINYRKEAEKITNMWRSNNMLQKDYWVKEEVKEKLKRYTEPMKRWHTIYNSWDAAKAALEGTYRIQAYFKKPGNIQRKT